MKMEKNIYKNIVVFGALGLIGKHVCEYLAKNGCNLVIADIDKERCANLAKELSKFDVSIYYDFCDITDERSLNNLLEGVNKEFHKIDSVINCSTYSSDDTLSISAPFEDYDIKEWKRMLSVNLDGPFLISKVFGSHMAKSGKGGSIIFLSSIYGFLGTDQSIYESINTSEKRFNNPASYSASKGGVISLAKYLASYWGKENIRVNVLSLGGIYNGQEDKFVRNYSAKVPMARMGNLEDLDGAIKFLLIEDSEYLTGQNLILDGGLSVW